MYYIIENLIINIMKMYSFLCEFNSLVIALRVKGLKDLWISWLEICFQIRLIVA